MTYRQGILGYPPDCQSCPLRGQPQVLPDGEVPTRLCIVGESPGQWEAREKRGFIGPSGMLLWTWAARAGIYREKVWVSNATLCLPPQHRIKLVTGAEVSREECLATAMACCRRRLVSELITVTQADPRATIIPVGKLALRALTNIKDPKIYAYRGSVIQIDLQALWEELTTGQTHRKIRLDGQ